MNHKPKFLIGIFVLCFLSLSVNISHAASTHLGISTGIGIPVGWWADRWDPATSGQFTIQYDLSPGTGFILFSGLSKNYFAELSTADIIGDSRLQNLPPEFEPYAFVTQASQSGSFNQIPIGVGFIFERLITIINTHQLRGYGKVAALVNLWSVKRDQFMTREIEVPNLPKMTHNDDWSDDADGSDLGAHASLGLLYQLTKNLFLDVSGGYSYLDVGKKNTGIIYYGFPSRLESSENMEPENSHIDFLQFAIGLRYTL